MGTVVDLRPRAREDFTRYLGMIIALAAWAMMFGALFFAYVGLRSRAPMWPPMGTPRLPIGLPALNTVVLLGSSVAFSRGVNALRQGRRGALASWVLVTAALGVTFLVLQLVVWRDLWAAGLLPSSGTYGSVFYGLTALHAVHVAAGLIALLVVAARALRGVYTEHNVVRVRVCGLFWHFVDAVWVLMFFSLYLF
ncbi:MAG: heme-copper oxidase subunit III [Polyangiaceae bacterium]|nr:heme-copper oxidase subunit III [Polyangiaceae bacterium]